MLLEQFMNESFSGSSYVPDVEPLFESYIQGEDVNELHMINREFNQQMNAINENVIFAAALSDVALMKGREEDAYRLQESVIGDVFTKIKEKIIELWRKIKAFFVNLFKSISVSVGKIENSLKGVEKILRSKDLSNFKYQMHDWKDSDMPNVITSNINKTVDRYKNTADTLYNQAKSIMDGSDNTYSSLEKEELDSDDSMVHIGNLVGASEKLTLQEANTMIQESYGCSGTPDEQTGLSDYTSMITFLKSFKNNKTIKKLQTDTDTAYKKAITAVDGFKSKADALKINDKADNQSDRTSARTKVVGMIKNISTRMTSTLSSYNSLMGTCINCNKQRFSEYRSIISKAVRYSGKKED